MGKLHTVFKRYEKKYLLKGDEYQKVREYLQDRMKVDEYGLSTICNIYYDTPNYDLITRSIEKPIYKEKLRLRSYGIPKEDDTVFLEVKKKYDGIVYKRRIPMKLKDAKESFKQRKIVGADGQIARELDYFLEHYDLKEGTYLAYDRIAMYGIEDPDFRITFDFNIRSRQENMDLAAGDQGQCIIPEDHVIMEVKVGDSYPFWIIRMFEELEIYPASFSKYGNVYKKIIFPNIMEKRRMKAKASQKVGAHVEDGYEKDLKEKAYV